MADSRKAVSEASKREHATISPDDAHARYVQAVKTRRVNSDARRVVDMTVEQLMTDDGTGGPVLYVPGPAHHRDRILRLYGGFTMLDFDELFSTNTKIGGWQDNCYNSMMFWMNETGGDLRDQWHKISHDPILKDVFNLIQSAVRSRIGESVWYE